MSIQFVSKRFDFFIWKKSLQMFANFLNIIFCSSRTVDPRESRVDEPKTNLGRHSVNILKPKNSWENLLLIHHFIASHIILNTKTDLGKLSMLNSPQDREPPFLPFYFTWVVRCLKDTQRHVSTCNYMESKMCPAFFGIKTLKQNIYLHWFNKSNTVRNFFVWMEL